MTMAPFAYYTTLARTYLCEARVQPQSKAKLMFLLPWCGDISHCGGMDEKGKNFFVKSQISLVLFLQRDNDNFFGNLWKNQPLFPLDDFSYFCYIHFDQFSVKLNPKQMHHSIRILFSQILNFFVNFSSNENQYACHLDL